MPPWIYFILTRDSSVKSFVFLSPRQTGSLCFENEGLWTWWWAHWGDPVSDPEELLNWAKDATQSDTEMVSQTHRADLTVPDEEVATEKSFFGRGLSLVEIVHNARSMSVTLWTLVISWIINIKLKLTVRWKSLPWHEQMPPIVTSAWLTNLQGIIRTHCCWSVQSNKASSLPQTGPTVCLWGPIKHNLATHFSS